MRPEKPIGAAEFPPLQPAGKLKTQPLPALVLSLTHFAGAGSSLRLGGESLFITNAYCAPSHNQVALLIGGEARVDVRLMVPGQHNDQPMTSPPDAAPMGSYSGWESSVSAYHDSQQDDRRGRILSMVSPLDSRSAQINEVRHYDHDEGFGAE